jgi:hypothetical protein
VTREEEDNRVFKKRRTSSDVLDEATLFEQEDHEAHPAASPDAAIDSEPEADPNGDEWEDLDADDGDDPLMVSEYVIEILDYMRSVEVSASHVDYPQPVDPSSSYSFLRSLIWTTCPTKRNLGNQCEGSCSTGPSRFTHVFVSSTKHFSCVSTSSTFLSARVVSLAKLQLVGITYLFVSKVEEIVAPSVCHFLHCAESSYTTSEILLAEHYVLKTIGWNLSFPNPMHFLRRISKADDYDVKARTIRKYFLEVGTLEWCHWLLLRP